jgi:hypothetical protein
MIRYFLYLGSACILRAPFGILPKNFERTSAGSRLMHARSVRSPRARRQKAKKIPPVVSGSPAHKIIGATSVDFGA